MISIAFKIGKLKNENIDIKRKDNDSNHLIDYEINKYKNGNYHENIGITSNGLNHRESNF